MKVVKYTVLDGHKIQDTARTVTRTAKERRTVVRFRFNGVRLFASPKKSPTTIVWEYFWCLFLKQVREGGGK